MRRSAWRPATTIVAAAAAFGLAACTAGGIRPDATPRGTSSGLTAALRELPDTPSRQSARAGIAALSSGDFTAASHAFNRALKNEPDNSHLHFLNGLAYHQLYATGAHDRAEFAEAGYILALEFDRTNSLAALQLGRLYMERRRYPDAQRRFADAVQLEPDDAEAWSALAAASYYARDMPMALQAIDTARRLAPNNTTHIRTSAVIRAAAGMSDAAVSDVQQYAVVASADETALLQRRIKRWTSLHDNPSGGGHPLESGAFVPGTQLAQAETPQSTSDQPAPIPAPIPTPTPEEMAAAAMSSVARALHWSDCPQILTAPPVGSYPSGSPSSQNNVVGDETTALAALPSPCTGRPMPRMAVFDVAIIRTDDTDTTSRGVNLLDGLQVLFTGSSARTESDPGNIVSKTITSSIGLPVAGIAYSLNIANADDIRNEVLARPSLVALDREPSNFFSGSNISVALPGQYGGSLVDKPIGVSLSATPTFIDDDTMLVAVRATRSFIESAAATSLEQSLQTSRNAISANVILKFDQTLILSGLREREITEADSGVPVLKEIPFLQNFFAVNTTSDFTKDVLILITPRRPAFFNDPASAQAGSRRGSSTPPAESESLDRLRSETAASPIQPNLATIMKSLQDNHFSHEFRTGDILIEPWRSGMRYDRILRDALNFLYF